MTGPSGGSTSTGTTYQTSLPEYAQPYWERLMDRTEGVSNTPYQAYPGQRVADFNDIQKTAAADTMGVAGSGYNNLGQLASQYGSQPGYTPTNVSTGQWNNGAAQQYMDPYAKNVTDIAVRNQQTQFGAQEQKARAQAAQQGAFGGSRAAILGQQRQVDESNLESDITTKGLSQAYQNAQGMYTSDQARGLQAQGMNVQQAQFADQSAGQKAGIMANIYGQQQTLGLQGANAIMGLGNQQQGIEQQGMNVDYSNFVNARDYDRNNLNFLSSIMHGATASGNRDTTTSNPTNPVAQGAGLGVAGLGLYNALTK